MGLLLNLINQFTQPGQMTAQAGGKASAEGGEAGQFDVLFIQLLGEQQTGLPQLSQQLSLSATSQTTVPTEASLDPKSDEEASDDHSARVEMDSNAMTNFNALVMMQTPLPLQQVIMPVQDAPPEEALIAAEVPVVSASQQTYSVPVGSQAPAIETIGKAAIHPMSLPEGRSDAKPASKSGGIPIPAEFTPTAETPVWNTPLLNASSQAKAQEIPGTSIATFDQRVTTPLPQSVETTAPNTPVNPNYVPPFITESAVLASVTVDAPVTGVSTDVHALIEQVAPWMQPQTLTRSEAPQVHVPPFITPDAASAPVTAPTPVASEVLVATTAPTPIRVSQGMILTVNAPEEQPAPEAIDDPDIFSVATASQASISDKLPQAVGKLPDTAPAGIESIQIEAQISKDMPEQQSDSQSFAEPHLQKSTEHPYAKQAEKHVSDAEFVATPTSAVVQTPHELHIQHHQENLSLDKAIQPIAVGPTQPMSDLPTIKPIESHSLFHSLATEPVDQVADGAISAMRTNRSEITMQLRPESLGQVTVNLSSNRNQEVSARIVAFSPEAHQVLTEHAHSLRQSLESQGIQVDRISVSLASAARSHVNQADSMQNNTANHQGGQFDSNNSDANRQTSQHNFQHQQQSQQAQTFFQQFQQQQSNSNGFQNTRASAHVQGQDASGFASEAKALIDSVRNDNGNVSILA